MSEQLDKYDRVTDVLGAFLSLDKIDPKVLANAQDRGTKTHLACEGILKGFEAPNDESINGYVNSFLKWWDGDNEIITHEERFYCNELMITGQIDIMIRDKNGVAWIVDLKTSSSPQKHWPMQIAAYRYLVRGPYNKAMIVRLKKDGKMPCVYEYDEQQLSQYWDMFKKCLDVYRLFHKNKEIIDIEQL